MSPSSPPATADDGAAPPDHRRLVAFAAVVAVVLAVAALALRSVEVDAENDHYHEVAEHLWQGRLYFDRFHPFGYPLLIALLMPVVGDALVAGCLVSAVAAGLTVYAAGVLAERLRPGSGLAAAALVGGNGLVLVHGTMASADMTGTALTLLATALVAARRPPTGWRAVTVGVLLGYAVGSRFAAAVVVPVLGLWLWRRGGLRAAGGCAVGGLLGYLPHGVLVTIATGSPLQNDNWHNLYKKVVCAYDFECLQHAYDTGTMPTASAFLAEHGGEVLRLAAADVVVAARDVLPAATFGLEDATPWLAVWPLLLAAVGLGVVARARGLGAVLLLLVGLQTVATCIAHAPFPRFLLAAVPLLSIGVAVACAAVPRPAPRRVLQVVVLGLTLVLAAKTYTRFLAQQPLAEVAVHRRLPELVPRPMCLLTTLPCAHRYVEARVLGWMAAGFATPEQAWAVVRDRMEGAGADVFAAGACTSPVLFAKLRAVPVPPDFTLLHADDETLVVERMPAVSPWIAGLRVEPPSPRVGERVELTLSLGADADPAAIAGGGVAVRDAAGEQTLLMLPAVDARTRRDGFVVPPVVGDWTCTPFLVRGDGQTLRGAPVTMRVRP